MATRVCRHLRQAIVVLTFMLMVTPAVFADGGLCPRVVDFSLGDRSATLWWRMENDEGEGIDELGIEGFGGYRLWMREVWKGEEFSLVLEYDIEEEDPEAPGYWPFDPFFAEPDSARDVTGDFFQNVFPYEFSVTAFKKSNPDSINEECRRANADVIGIVYPNVGVKEDLAHIQVIPNPYRSSADWEYGGQRRVTFVGLPHESTIRIYTVAADHVITLDPEGQRDDQHDWDLRNEDGEEIAPGVYIWQVEAPDTYGPLGGPVETQDGGVKYGRLMVIK
jgi:hypothetical protein